MYTYSQLEEMYIEMLDESGVVYAGGIGFYPSRILEEMDPVAYRCGFGDFVDSLGIDIDEVDE